MKPRKFTCRLGIALLLSLLARASAWASITANPQSVTVTFNTATPIVLTGTSTLNVLLTYSTVTAPTHGGLTGSAPNLTYTPTLNYAGADNFTFKVSTGVTMSTSTTVTITVNAPAAAPVANAQSVTTNQDVPKAVTLSGSDPNSLALTYSIVTSPAHGSLIGTAPNVTYSPATAYTGADIFVFKVNNGFQDSSNATVSVTVLATGPLSLDPPTINLSGAVSLNDVITLTPDPCCNADTYVWTFTPITPPTNPGPITVSRPGLQLSLANLGLQIGTYQLRVHGVTGSVQSADSIKTLTIVSSTLSNLRVYPNPWRSDRDADVGITFDSLTPGATIKIFDMAAHWVRTLDATSNSISWDRRNDSGDWVASGLYLYLVTDNQGGKARGKLTLIK